MVNVNQNYLKLGAGYLFPEIGKRVKAFQQANPDVKVYRLGVGNTTEALTPTIIAGLHSGVDKLADVKTYSGYGDEQGNTDLKEALQKKYAKLGVSLSLDEIFVSDGAKCDSGNIQELFSDKSVIAVQDPAYPVYVDTNVMGGRTGAFDVKTKMYDGIVYMPCNAKNGFFPKIPNQKVDLIYICSPNNPTGAVATRKQLEEFVLFARVNNSVIIFDSAYAAYIKDKNLPKSIYEIEGADDCAIEISSFSKDFGFTGVRLGWSVVPKKVMGYSEDSTPVSLNSLWNRRYTTKFNGASNVVQAGGLAGLTKEGRKESRQLVNYYMKNGQLIREGLSDLGFNKIYGGENAPYLWVKTPNKMKSWDFFDKMLKEAHVVVTPGVGFGPSGEGFVRFSPYGHREDIKAAMKSIKTNLKL
ncbi:MAG: LL-diaminopimelate aminotransferase [Candidatus Woesearchaeota archaeon]|jgi:LL-diaminopimelate aminotransferase